MDSIYRIVGGNRSVFLSLTSVVVILLLCHILLLHSWQVVSIIVSFCASEFLLSIASSLLAGEKRIFRNRLREGNTLGTKRVFDPRLNALTAHYDHFCNAFWARNRSIVCKEFVLEGGMINFKSIFKSILLFSSYFFDFLLPVLPLSAWLVWNSTRSLLSNFSCTTVSLRKFVARKSLKALLYLHGFWTFMLCFSTFTESARQICVHLTMKSTHFKSFSKFFFHFRNASELLLRPEQCFIRMVPQFFGISGNLLSSHIILLPTFVLTSSGSITSMLVMALERTEASYKLSAFESAPNKNGTKFIILHVQLYII